LLFPYNTSIVEILRQPIDESTQYASYDFRDVLAEYGITSSTRRKGNCWDNACSETLFGSLKVERLHGKRFKTRREAKDETVDWLLWYNRARLHSTLAYVSPIQFAQDWLVNQQSKPIREFGYGVQIPGARSYLEADTTSNPRVVHNS